MNIKERWSNSSKQRRTMMLLMLGCILALVGFDIYVSEYGDPTATISQIMRKISMEWLTMPFFCGLTAGHFFWPNDETPNGWRGLTLFTRVTLPIVLGVLVLDFIWLHPVNLLPVAFAAGFITGHFAWPMKKSYNK